MEDEIKALIKQWRNDADKWECCNRNNPHTPTYYEISGHIVRGRACADELEKLLVPKRSAVLSG